MLNLVDEFTRECLAIEIASSITSAKVRHMLERVCRERGFPAHIRSEGREEIKRVIKNCIATNEPGTIRAKTNGRSSSCHGYLFARSGEHR